ncbi:hypothetical protein KI387_035893 [Taxus chinensis]|uniref:Protein kinase domain-containing protein n=1 Tax=Taxus chinensis TaxID=29808 RepID=A0AA38FNP9_TAXCH|nr:hypothetical protein KI387_035893 [Taxus chinensis]
MVVEGGRMEKKSATLLVGVDAGLSSRELLTWTLMKLAQTGDHVIVVHVLSSPPANSAPKHKQEHIYDYHLTRPFDANIFDVYESFCRLKQVDLQVKVSHGSAVRKVLTAEASLYKATKLIIGKSKQKAFGSSKSLATYCAKNLPCTCSVLVVDNGTVIFEKVGTQSLQGTGARIRTLNSIKQLVRGALPNDGLDDPCSVAGRHSDAAIIPSAHICYPAGQGIIPIEMDAFKSCLPLKPVCMFCTSNTSTVDDEEKDAQEQEARNSESYSSCDSFRTVSSRSCRISQKEEDIEISSDKPKEIEDAQCGRASQRQNSPPGWPLLKRAITANKIPSPRAVDREMTVVEWALQLPDRRGHVTGNLPSKTEISQEGCNNMSELQAPNGVTLREESCIEVESPSTTENESIEENSLIQRLRHLCKKRTCKQFTYQELKSATSGFSADKLIGKGGWSNVYRGTLLDGQSVAVKLLKASPETEEELLMEVEITTTLQHQHIISLIGYCVEEQKYLLVYNLLLRGSLEENLYGGNERPLVPWNKRLKVAIGVAEALTYLHDGCPRPIIHRDVKSSNILLSEDYEPQLSDFGLAKWASTTSAYITCSDVVGTFGYLAPEYFRYGKVNQKTDVYSFGVVLLELITGRKPINSNNPKGQESLVMWARPLLGDGVMEELVDPHLEDSYDVKEMKRMIIGAALCVRQASQLRPRMSRILKILRGETDDLSYWSKRRLLMSKDMDETVEDDYGANYGGSDIQTHLTLAMLWVDDDIASVSSPDQSVDLLHQNKTLEDYFRDRYSRSSSFD